MSLLHPPLLDAIGIAIARISAILAEESSAIRAGHLEHLSRYTDMKARALLQLDRSLRTLDPRAVSAGLAAPLGELRDRLEENRHLLGIQVEAARRVSEIIAAALIAGDSDGTYARHREGGVFGS